MTGPVRYRSVPRAPARRPRCRLSAARRLGLCLLLLACALPSTGIAQEAPPLPRFEDRTDGSGLEVVTWSGGPAKDHILESAGNGVLVVDLDLDGWQDLYFVSALRFDEEGNTEIASSRLFRNGRDLTFSDITAAAGVGTEVFGSGGCVGDYDGDGWPDLYVTVLGDDILFRNNGDGTFSRVDTGISAPGWSTGAAFVDADGDGDPDLYVAGYIDTTIAEAHAAVRRRMWRGRVAVLDGPRGLRGDPNYYFVNNGDGTFSDATSASGLDPMSDHFSFAVLTFDADEDGDPDLYVANDSQGNALYVNHGDGTFTEEGMLAGIGYNANGTPQGSMGIDAGDIDNDGLPEVSVTNFASDSYTLYRSLGGGIFLDATFDTGIATATYTPLGWGTFFFDADLDGDQDLFYANGHLYVQVDEAPALEESYRQRNQLMLNEGGVFREITTEAGSGLAIVESSRGAVPVDLDNDGDLDIVVSNQDARPNLLENVTPSAGGWIGFELADPTAEREALNARVTIRTGKGSQWRENRSGGTYISESDPRLHFGLGGAEITGIEVRWRDGTVERLGALEPGAYYRVVRGRSPQRLR